MNRYLTKKKVRDRESTRFGRTSGLNKSLMRPVSRALQFEERDVELLKEYGFKPRTMSSARLNKKKVDEMNMRQLDRLKMLLLRNSPLCGGYPEEIQIGIAENDLIAFCKAVALLSNFLVPK